MSSGAGLALASRNSVWPVLLTVVVVDPSFSGWGLTFRSWSGGWACLLRVGVGPVFSELGFGPCLSVSGGGCPVLLNEKLKIYH